MSYNLNIPTHPYKFLFRFLKPMRAQAIILWFIIALMSTVHVFDGMLIRALTNRLNSGNLDGIYLFVLYYYVWWQSHNLGWRSIDYYQMKIIPKLKINIIDTLTAYCLMHSHKFFQESFAGSISNRISDASKSADKLFLIINYTILRKSLAILFPMFLILSINVYLGIGIMIWIGVFIGLSIYFSSPIKQASSYYAKQRSLMLGKIVDTITNVSNVRLFAGKNHEREYLSQYLGNARISNENAMAFTNKINLLKGILNSIGIALVMSLLIYIYKKGTLSVGDVTLCLTVFTGITSEIWNLSQEMGEYNEEVGVLNDVLNNLIIPHHIYDKTASSELKISNAEIKFEKVIFNYNRNNRFFDNLSVTIRSGEKVGLVGYSGSGKSTFVNLIIRLYDIDGGCISIDNQDVQEVTQDSLRKNISLIPQDPSLFHRTFMENIRYGKPSATDEEVMDAAKRAHAHEFIMQTDAGYNSLVGERGMRLSGGQRQRVAIARAILKDAPILILDEATSALDSITENIIQDALSQLYGNKTVLVIAHRLSTLLDMDRIIVFDKGVMVEEGTHEELIKKQGSYHALWSAQVGGFLPDHME